MASSSDDARQTLNQSAGDSSASRRLGDPKYVDRRQVIPQPPAGEIADDGVVKNGYQQSLLGYSRRESTLLVQADALDVDGSQRLAITCAQNGCPQIESDHAPDRLPVRLTGQLIELRAMKPIAEPSTRRRHSSRIRTAAGRRVSIGDIRRADR